MLTGLAVFLLESSPAVRRLLWRWWYGRLARRYTKSDWTFMNYGFLSVRRGEEGLSSESMAKEDLSSVALAKKDLSSVALAKEEEPDRLYIQLYQRVVSSVSLSGCRVLEVGAGRGGGASFLARHHGPARLTAVDFSPPAVDWCRRRHAGVPNLEFLVGDAENLPFPDASFDAVVNVESSHCYGNVARFYAEAARVLRPGGHFLYTDFRTVADLAALEQLLDAQPDWQRVAREDITTAVADAMQADNDRKRALIETHIPPRFRHLFGEFAGLVGGQIYAGFRAGTLKYCRYAYRKS